MKLLIAYIRPECTSNVVRALYTAGVGGISAYEVRGLRAESKSVLIYRHDPFGLSHLDEAVKLEAICTDESIETMVRLIAEHAWTGEPGDGLIAVQEVKELVRIRDVKQPSCPGETNSE
jgi:nitrogen regulatory protein P-II 1